MRIRATVLVPFVLLAFASQSTRGGDPEPPAVEPYAGWIPGAAPDDRTVFVVCDGRTGAPLPGVRVRRHLEPEIGADGTWAPVRAEATTDRFGLVSFPLAESGGTTPSHWTFDLAGYAPDAREGAQLEDTMFLFPGRDLHGRLLAPLGGGAAGVRVEWTKRCEHAPALRTVTTDAEGRYVIPCADLDGDLWFDGRGIAGFRGSAENLLAPTATAVDPLRTEAASALVGRVVGLDAKALAGAVVLVGTGRGPRAPVAADGTFRVEGGGGLDHLRLVRGIDETLASLEPGSVRPGGPFVWDLRATAKREPVEVVVRVTCAGDTRDPRDVESIDVHLDSTLDGRRVTVRARAEQGALLARLRAPPGPYELSAESREWESEHRLDDGPIGRWAAPPRAVHVEAGANPSLDLSLEARPAVRLVSPDPAYELPRHGGYALATARGNAGVLVDPEGPPLHVPADLEAVVWTGELPSPLGPVREGVRTAVVDPRSRVVLHLRDIRSDAVRVDGRVIAAEWMDPGYRVPYDGPPGRHRIEYDAEQGAGRAWADVDVPDGRGVVVQVPGDVWQWPATSDVVIAPLPETKPPRIDVYVVLDPGETPLPPGEAGVFRSPLLTEGRWVRVEADGYLPRRAPLAGPGPWRVAFGAATLVLRIRGAAPGESVDALVDGWTPGRACWAMPDRTSERAASTSEAVLTVKGLLPGEHTVLVGSEARGAVRVRVRLAQAETRTVDVLLPPR